LDTFLAVDGIGVRSEGDSWVVAYTQDVVTVSIWFTKCGLKVSLAEPLLSQRVGRAHGLQEINE
tara:strand:+ start:870 stop:1061 length:192 start_codon:yes stop_codon:yes gene_type:complete